MSDEKSGFLANLVRGIAVAVVGLVLLVAAAAGLFLLAEKTGLIKFGHSHPKYREATANLKAAYTAQRAFQQEKDRYSTNTVELGFSPERGNRYAYFFAPEGTLQLRDKAPLAPSESAQIIGLDTFKYGVPTPTTFAATGCTITLGKAPDGQRLALGVVGTELGQHFVVAAAGNLDADPKLDCWSISDVDRTNAKGEPVPAGVPYREVSDE